MWAWRLVLVQMCFCVVTVWWRLAGGVWSAAGGRWARCVQSALPITPLTPHAITNPTHSSSTNSTLPTLPTPTHKTLQPTTLLGRFHSTLISCSRLTLLNPHLEAFYLSCEGQNYLPVDRQISSPRVCFHSSHKFFANSILLAEGMLV